MGNGESKNTNVSIEVPLSIDYNYKTMLANLAVLNNFIYILHSGVLYNIEKQTDGNYIAGALNTLASYKSRVEILPYEMDGHTFIVSHFPESTNNEVTIIFNSISFKSNYYGSNPTKWLKENTKFILNYFHEEIKTKISDEVDKLTEPYKDLLVLIDQYGLVSLNDKLVKGVIKSFKKQLTSIESKLLKASPTLSSTPSNKIETSVVVIPKKDIPKIGTTKDKTIIKEIIPK